MQWPRSEAAFRQKHGRACKRASSAVMRSSRCCRAAVSCATRSSRPCMQIVMVVHLWTFTLAACHPEAAGDRAVAGARRCLSTGGRTPQHASCPPRLWPAARRWRTPAPRCAAARPARPRASPPQPLPRRRPRRQSACQPPAGCRAPTCRAQHWSTLIRGVKRMNLVVQHTSPCSAAIPATCSLTADPASYGMSGTRPTSST